MFFAESSGAALQIEVVSSPYVGAVHTYEAHPMEIKFERFIEAAKLGALIVGGFFALVPWWYNFLEQRAKATQAAAHPWESEFPFSLRKVRDFGNGTFLYDVEMNVRLKNISASEFDLSYSIEEVYIGCLDISDISTMRNALIVNVPPSPWSSKEGAIRWERRGVVIGVSGKGEENHNVMDWLKKTYPNEKVVRWAGMTGPVSSGTSVQETPAFVVKARPDDYIAIVMSFGINGTIDPNSPLCGVLTQAHQAQRFSDGNEKATGGG
jgi:hypothetical protein